MNIKRLKALLFSVLMISCIALFLSSCGDSTDELRVLTYEEYIGLSAEEQSLYFDSFSTPEEFINWYNNAKAKYDALHNPSDDENSEEEIEGSIGLGGAVPGEGTEEDSEDDSDKTNEDDSDKTDEDDLPTTDDGKNNEGGENPDDSSEENPDKTDDPSQNENNDTDAPTTDDSDSTTDSDDSATDGEGTGESSKYEGMLTWSEYIALSEEEQMAFFRSFEDPLEFFEWQEYATKKYEEENKGLDPGDGNIDLGGN